MGIGSGKWPWQRVLWPDQAWVLIRGKTALVSLTWEGRTLAPDQVQDIHIGERYLKWLKTYFR